MTPDERDRLRTVEVRMERLTEDIKNVQTTLDSIDKTLSEARGGWKTLMMIGGASAAIGGLIVKLLPLLDRP